MADRNDASVLPEPVGAWIRTCSPLAIAGQPGSCAGGGAAKARSTHARVVGENVANGSGLAIRPRVLSARARAALVHRRSGGVRAPCARTVCAAHGIRDRPAG